MSWIKEYNQAINTGGFSSQHSIFNFIREYLLDTALKQNRNYYTSDSDGLYSIQCTWLNLKSGKKQKDLIAELEALSVEFKLNCIKHDDDFWIYDEDTFLTVGVCEKQFSYALTTLNDDLKPRVEALFKKYLSGYIKHTQSVYTLIPGMGGLELLDMGSFDKKLIETNYNIGVVDSFNDAVKEIRSKTPRGRLTILYGQPGTGKTYLLRSIVNDVKGCLFIFVQPEVFRKYGSNDIVKSLKRFGYSKNVLLVEDADSLLLDREVNNTDIVSSILNLTDGFMAEAMNVHIVATTNIDKLKIDEAYRRKGRLNKFIEIGELTTEEAQIAYDAINSRHKKPHAFTAPATLAEVYSIANFGVEEDSSSGKKKKDKKAVGFAK